jgi:Putative restriction endonuclease
MPTAAVRRVVVDDPTFYPDTDDMGEPTLQISISILLLALIERWLAARGKPAFVGMDTFFYWRQFVPTDSVAPDVYVLPGVPLDVRPRCWKVFETGKVPSFAFEVVSVDVEKDYLVSARRYDALGAKELVVFDPEASSSKSKDRLVWQVFRRVGKRGLVRVDASNGDRVRSRSLGCWLRAIGRGDDVRVRLGTGPEGELLFPTEQEEREQERARFEAERDAERGRLEAEIARLRAELARVTTKRGG